MHAMLPARGQGGNQSMKDAAVLLPLIVQLADLAKLNKHATSLQIAGACEKYENEMIPRTFAWVQKSGGNVNGPLLHRNLSKTCARRQFDANQFKHALWQACVYACGTGFERYMVILHGERMVHIGDIFGRCTRACLLVKHTCIASRLGLILYIYIPSHLLYHPKIDSTRREQMLETLGSD